MGFFSWLLGNKKRKNSPELRRYLGDDIETESEESSVAVEQKPKNKKKKKAPSPPEIETQPTLQEENDSENIIEDVQNMTEVENATDFDGKTSGFFDIKKSKDNRYVFNLFAANKVMIACSRVYSSAQSALGGVNSVISTADKANIEDRTKKNYVSMPFPRWEIYKDKAGQFRFRLMASNGICICRSQGYKAKASCVKGIESIIRSVKNAQIDRSYLNKKG